MAEGNGDSLLHAKSANKEECTNKKHTNDYYKLIEAGLSPEVAAKLEEIYNVGKLVHEDLDERAMDALKDLNIEGATCVLKQFLESNLEHVSNKSAYLCGVMKTYRQKSRLQSSPSHIIKGPDEEKIKLILDRTGYSLDVTTGQRKYGGPPPNWEGNIPGNGCEVFCGKIPKDIFEDELIPLFEKCGTIWDLRLMMDPISGLNRGYCFVTFVNRENANEAVKELDNFEIKKGKTLKVNISVPNQRLFVGNIPKSKGKDEILDEFSKITGGLMDVIIYSSPDDKKKNRGFCFLEYESHKTASLAKRRLSTGRIKVWGCDIIVDWADPQEEPDQETMSKVKVLYVRNLTQEASEDHIKSCFEAFGKIERVKKIKDYAFIHFEDRDAALKAMKELQSHQIAGAPIEISLAKPPSDKKKKEEMLRKREMRMMQMLSQRGPLASPNRARNMMRGIIGRDYNFDYNCYGYSNFRNGYGHSNLGQFYRYEALYNGFVPGSIFPFRGKYSSVGRRARGRQSSYTHSQNHMPFFTRMTMNGSGPLRTGVRGRGNLSGPWMMAR